jgi:hypothetical protein
MEASLKEINSRVESLEDEANEKEIHDTVMDLYRDGRLTVPQKDKYLSKDKRPKSVKTAEDVKELFADQPRIVNTRPLGSYAEAEEIGEEMKAIASRHDIKPEEAQELIDSVSGDE